MAPTALLLPLLLPPLSNGASGWEVEPTASAKRARQSVPSGAACGLLYRRVILFVFVLLPLLVGADPIIPFQIDLHGAISLRIRMPLSDK